MLDRVIAALNCIYQLRMFGRSWELLFHHGKIFQSLKINSTLYMNLSFKHRRNNFPCVVFCCGRDRLYTPSSVLSIYYINKCRDWGRLSIRCWIKKITLYLSLTGELWGVICEYFWNSLPRHNGIALYYAVDTTASLLLSWCQWHGSESYGQLSHMNHLMITDLGQKQRDYTSDLLCYVINDPCPAFNDGLAKHGIVIISNGGVIGVTGCAYHKIRNHSSKVS